MEGKNMQNYAKKCQKNIYAKIIQNMPFFLPIKHLFCFKEMVNRCFNLWKCAVSGCVWKHPGWFLSVFMHFYEGLDDFWTIFGYFWPFLTVFGPFWSQKWVEMAQNRAKMGPKWDKNVSFWGDFGPFLGRSGHSGVTSDHFGIALASFWGRFGVVWPHFRPFLVRFGVIFAYF